MSKSKFSLLKRIIFIIITILLTFGALNLGYSLTLRYKGTITNVYNEFLENISGKISNFPNDFLNEASGSETSQ